MAFNPSYNILDKDTHNTLVEALKSGGIGYTEADGTVHKISDTYASGGGGGSSLPEVSADDNGDVLTVVEGEWAKAAPSGGGYDAIINFSVDDGGNITATLVEGTFADVTAKMMDGDPVSIACSQVTEEAYEAYLVEGIAFEEGEISFIAGTLSPQRAVINDTAYILATWTPCFGVSWATEGITVLEIV